MQREKRREESGDGYYTLRYIAKRDDGAQVGTYGVNFRPDGTPYGASRDRHTPVTDVAAYNAGREAYMAWCESDDDTDPPPYYGAVVEPCTYCDDKPASCDGSSLVEIIVNNDERCFRIAEMMAG